MSADVIRSFWYGYKLLTLCTWWSHFDRSSFLYLAPNPDTIVRSQMVDDISHNNILSGASGLHIIITRTDSPSSIASNMDLSVAADISHGDGGHSRDNVVLVVNTRQVRNIVIKSSDPSLVADPRLSIDNSFVCPARAEAKLYTTSRDRSDCSTEGMANESNLLSTIGGGSLLDCCKDV